MSTLLKNKKILLITFLSALVIGFLTLANLNFVKLPQFFEGKGEKIIPAYKDVETPLAFIRPDTGLNIEFTTDGVPENLIIEGRPVRVIYERYRFFNTETGEEIDIRSPNVRAFVTAPGKQEQQITTGNIFYLMPIYPFSLPGEYSFRVITADGKTHEYKLLFNEPRKVELILGEERKLEANGVKDFQVVRLIGVSLSGAETIIHISPNNITRTYFAGADGSFLVESDVIKGRPSMFLVKQNNIWYYAKIL